MGILVHMMVKNYYVVARKEGKYLGTISGLGGNDGTLDCSLPKQTARKFARQLSKFSQWEGCEMVVETHTVNEHCGVFKGGVELQQKKS